MKKLTLLTLKSYIGPLLLTFFISLFVLVMQFLWKYIDDIVGKGLPWYVVGELLFYASTTFIPLALPLSVLLASIMTFGNLGENYELVAIKSAGISLFRVMKPLILLSIFISIFAFYFSNNILPYSNLKFKSILYDVKEQKLALNIREGIFYNDIDGFSIKINKKSKDDTNIEDIIIYDHSNYKASLNVTIAKTGKMLQSKTGEILELYLNDGSNYVEQKSEKGKSFQRTYFKEQYRRIDLSGFKLSRTDESLFRNNSQMLDLKDLNKATDSIRSDLNKINKEVLIIFNNNYSNPAKIADTSILSSHFAVKQLVDSIITKEKVNSINLAISNIESNNIFLEYHLSNVESKTMQLNKYTVEWHRKFTLSFACLILFLVGAPLGAIIRKGGLGMPLVVSIIFFVIYHVISITGEKAARAGEISSALGMWIASIVILPLGFWLTIKANNDSAIMDIDSWKKNLKRFIIFKK